VRRKLPFLNEETALMNSINHNMVMKCVAYENGIAIGDVVLEDISEVLKRDNTFIWLGLEFNMQD
jgi:magnesium transporter